MHSLYHGASPPSSWCVGLNSLIKSNQSQSRLKKCAMPPTIVSIDVHSGLSLFQTFFPLSKLTACSTQDVLDISVLATTASTLISILTFNYIPPLLLPASSPSPFHFPPPNTITKKPLHPSILPFLLLHHSFGSNDPIHVVLHHLQGGCSCVCVDAGVSQGGFGC